MAEFALDYEHLSDVELARLVTRRDPSAVRVITRRNNQRLYRAAWRILKPTLSVPSDGLDMGGAGGRRRRCCRLGIKVTGLWRS